MKTHLRKLVALAGICVCALAQASQGTTPELKVSPAHAWVDASHMMLLDAARAGSRIVAVGEHGLVLFSDDKGKTYKQASVVPISSTLTSVYFSDASHGWGVGQWGAIIATQDGGKTWRIQRADTSTDRPLFSVYFTDPLHGWAVGLWSLMLQTSDGGAHWSPVTLPPPPGSTKADRNLFRIFGAADGTLYVAAEQGLVLRSRDHGTTWEYRKTGGKGSLWAGAVASDGTVLVGGLLGHLYESHDGGDTWAAVETRTSSSITDLAVTGDRVVGVGLDGLMLSGTANSQDFDAKHREDRRPLTAIISLAGSNATVLFAKDGVVSGD
ncbi:YCF48-related protein [Paraburkholderia sp. CNPSo 3272]|uniref:WD40/YVTN/BNR-like repeat-containing protein n=1 Tax=Paraburkholderia sp. CNPSo 3272 TaxID=2940931 RepID=UPI0020B84FE7|nr:YCF48-related protein [Paraburkholderia sp. CNPSo 3272]MCP3727107.1 YCF48-related protein [Paraburkholderia sp. CNPSo 3272]